MQRQDLKKARQREARAQFIARLAWVFEDDLDGDNFTDLTGAIICVPPSWTIEELMDMQRFWDVLVDLDGRPKVCFVQGCTAVSVQ